MARHGRAGHGDGQLGRLPWECRRLAVLGVVAERSYRDRYGEHGHDGQAARADPDRGPVRGPIARTRGWRARARSLRPVRYQVSEMTGGTAAGSRTGRSMVVIALAP